VNTVIEEPKAKASGQASSRDAKIRQQAAEIVPAKGPMKSENTVQPKDCYESCLDLSALFLGRG
jgi:hypothetical protein